jgi:hypothetical protein
MINPHTGLYYRRPRPHKPTISLEGTLARVRVVAITYYDDRGIGGSEGVTIYHRRPGRARRESMQARMEDWYALAHSVSDGGCYVKYGPLLIDYPASESPNKIFGDHDIAVHIELLAPLYFELTAPHN